MVSEAGSPGSVTAGDLLPSKKETRRKSISVRRLYLLPAVILLIGIPVSILLFTILRDAVGDVARLRFERQASDAKGIIKARIQSYAEMLYALRALFATHGFVTRAQFHQFVAGLELKARYPGFDSVNFAAYVKAEDAKRFAEEVRLDTSVEPGGYPHFAIQPPGDRPEYYVLAYLEPMVGYEFAFGRDLGASTGVTQPEVVAAAQRAARDSGKLAASGLPIRIKTNDDEYVGLAMRLPVYRSGMPVDTVEDRRAAYLGSVGAGFNVQKLMKGALTEEAGEHMQFRLFDVGSAGELGVRNAPSIERLLFDSNRPRTSRPDALPIVDPGRHFTRVLPFEVGGRIWEVHFSALKDQVMKPVDALLPWVVLLGGLVSSLLLSGLFYSLASSRSRAMQIAQDITKDLRESEASLAEAQRMARLGNWSFDPSTGLMKWSAQTYRTFGLEPGSEIVQFTEFLQRVHEDDRPAVDEALIDAIEAKERRELEHRITAHDGGTRWVHTIVQASSLEGEVAVSGTMMDITERKLAKQELIESRALLIDAQKLSHVGCCQYNPLDGRVLWSEELCRIHGVDPQTFEPTYESAMRLVHPKDRLAWKNALVAALRDGSAFTTEFRIVRPDGSVRHLRSLGEVIKDALGRPARMLWSVLDITEQKATEATLRASADQLTALSRRLVEVQEAERRQLSRELHDRVGQNLTALSINLDMLRTSLSGDECAPHRARLKDSSALLESTVDSIENVMAELRPPMLDDYGLLPALHWYAKDFSKRTGIDVSVLGNEGLERTAPELEITLFRIAQEALTNVAKHAHAKRVQIQFEHTNSHCVMTVTDDGIGLEAASSQAGRQRRGLGMVTMRERTQAVGGRFDVETVPGSGTRIAIRIP